MKAAIDVKDRKEADAIRAGLQDPAVRAFVIVIGVLQALPSDRARKRVLQYVKDRFEEQDEMGGVATERQVRPLPASV